VVIKDIIRYEKNGNTHWIIVLSNNSYVELSAENMSVEDIIKVNGLKAGEVYNWS